MPGSSRAWRRTSRLRSIENGSTGTTARYAGGTQTSFSAPLAAGLTEPDSELDVLDQLVETLKQSDYTITSGEIGHRYLLAALTRLDRPEVVQHMLEQTTRPYYAYQVAHGATSLAEYWDGPTIGHSQNHFMMGHMEEWFYSVLAGIRVDYDEMGTDPITIQPYIAEGVEWAHASHLLPQGHLEVRWNKEPDGMLQLQVDVPVSAKVVVAIPSSDAGGITESGRALSEMPEITFLRKKKGYVLVRIESGTYTFRSAV